MHSLPGYGTVVPSLSPELARAARKALLSRGDENLSAHGSLRRALVAARLKDGGPAWANVRKILDNGIFVAHRASGPRREVELPAGKSVEIE
ncbi:hypothetical protein ACIBQ1_04305 [Nonomuraea sp. NPDC050153]|uniref:hypothetical protein n=1 Tax=Nonomuraea sp. NPDC050153 TaxID=3364359 RepID=UPI003788B82F